MQPKDWLPPYPPGVYDRYNQMHREGWYQCATLLPNSTFGQRTTFAHGYARAKTKLKETT